MGSLLYFILIPFIYGVSLLPFWWMYRLSDLLYLILFKIVGYRKQVVLTNLRNSFPEKPEAEIRKICTDFYKYFCDLVLETLKTLTISPAQLRKHAVFEDLAVFKKYYQQKQSVVIIMGHLGNWELGGARFALEPFHKLYVIYHPLENKRFDRLVYHMRTRLGNGLYAMRDTFKCMLRDRGDITATAFIADQTPSPKGAFWLDFLNQDTPIFSGTEKLACKLEYPVLYISMDRPRRGYYTIKVEELHARPQDTAEMEITRLHTKRLEDDIKEKPHLWLWTHKRWKHKR